MQKCLLCVSSVKNEVLLGIAHERGKNFVHENCLYLTSNLVQRGNEENGICCFIWRDIVTESKRCQQLRCCYCHQMGANIGCCKSNCRQTFHTYCGITHGAQNQFVSTYKSFCHQHIEKHDFLPNSTEKCFICLEQLKDVNAPFSFTKHIYGSCCNTGWYHRDCLQQYADSAGYFFKCPLCNDSTKFRKVVLWGVTVPDRDASWELTDAFDDQLEVPTSCTADNCSNAAGRKSTKDELFYCMLCGGNPVHPECIKNEDDNYCCDVCDTIGKMAESYHQEEEQHDPLEVYIANLQAMRKQKPETANKQPSPSPSPLPSPPLNISSNSEDEFAIVTAKIDDKKLSRGQLPTVKQSLVQVSPLRLRSPLVLTPHINAENVAHGQRSTLADNLEMQPITSDEENMEMEKQQQQCLPQKLTAVRRRTRSSGREPAPDVPPPTRRSRISDKPQVDEEIDTRKQPPPVANRRTRSNSNLETEKEVDMGNQPPPDAKSRARSRAKRETKEEVDMGNQPPPLANRRTRSNSKRETEEEVDMGNQPPLAKRRTRSNSKRETEEDVDMGNKPPPAAKSRARSRAKRETKEEVDMGNQPPPLANRRTRSNSKRETEEEVDMGNKPPPAAKSRARSRAKRETKEDVDMGNQPPPLANRRTRSNSKRETEEEVDMGNKPPPAAKSRARSRAKRETKEEVDMGNQPPPLSKRRTRSNSKLETEEEVDMGNQPPPLSKRRTRSNSKLETEEEVDMGNKPPPLSKRRTRSNSKLETEEEVDMGNQPPPLSKRRTRSNSKLETEEEVDMGNQPPPLSKRRTRSNSKRETEEEVDMGNKPPPAAKSRARSRAKRETEEDVDMGNKPPPLAKRRTRYNSKVEVNEPVAKRRSRSTGKVETEIELGQEMDTGKPQLDASEHLATMPQGRTQPSGRLDLAELETIKVPKSAPKSARRTAMDDMKKTQPGPGPGAIRGRRNTCVSPLQMISRGRTQAKNSERDISCVANRTRARSRK